MCDSFTLHHNKREFYFDRSPRIFENILGLYRKGELHLTERVCPRDFLGEYYYRHYYYSITLYKVNWSTGA